MRMLLRISSCGIAVAWAAASIRPAHADDAAKPAALVQVPSEDGSMPSEESGHPSVEPAVTHPPWTGREALWGGVGLAVAGAAALIIATPIICFSTDGTSTVGSSPSHAACFATLGGSLGAIGLGGVLLVVGEMQRASYKQWLRAHPMFSGLTVGPTTVAGGRGASMTWTASF
jgi:hypothetical protein